MKKGSSTVYSSTFCWYGECIKFGKRRI